MKTNIATDKSQSARLLACGVPADTADMARYEDDSISMMEWDWTTGSYGGTFPAFSLSRLLELLPKLIFDKNHEGFYFSLAKECASSADYNAAYKPCWTEETDNLIEKRSPSPIEACVQLIEWLMQNGYKLNEIKEK